MPDVGLPSVCPISVSDLLAYKSIIIDGLLIIVREDKQTNLLSEGLVNYGLMDSSFEVKSCLQTA